MDGVYVLPWGLGRRFGFTSPSDLRTLAHVGNVPSHAQEERREMGICVCLLGLDGSLLAVGVAPVIFTVHLPRPFGRSRRPGFSLPSKLSDVMAPNKGSRLWVMSCQPSK